MSSSQTKAVIGRFQTQRLLGIGSGGRVWLAVDSSGAQVALKVSADADQRARLRREATALQQLSHRYVVRLVDADPEGRWLATEFVAGSTLSTWGAQRSLAERIELCARLAEAVAHLHKQGLVHGDLKPGNVMVDAFSAPKLIDLGTARSTDHSGLDEGFSGTLGYVGPELLSGGAPSMASDVYSLGAIAYTLVTRQAPFRSGDPAALAFLPLSTFPEPPSSRVPRMPRALDELILQMLARTAERRPKSMVLSGRLRRALRSPSVSPVVGMNRARGVLREGLAKALDGGTLVVVLHGGEGSGRRTLIQECVALARREGMRILQGPGERPKELLASLEGQDRGSLIQCQGGGREVLSFAGRLLSHPLPALLLIRSERPLMPLTNLGARHISPKPLEKHHVQLLLSANDQDVARATEIMARTRGRPGAVAGYVQPLGRGMSGLTPLQIELVQMTSSSAVVLPELAKLLKIGEHEVLDLAEPLLDRGLLVEVADGFALQAVHGS